MLPRLPVFVVPHLHEENAQWYQGSHCCNKKRFETKYLLLHACRFLVSAALEGFCSSIHPAVMMLLVSGQCPPFDMLKPAVQCLNQPVVEPPKQLKSCSLLSTFCQKTSLRGSQLPKSLRLETTKHHIESRGIYSAIIQPRNTQDYSKK